MLSGAEICEAVLPPLSRVPCPATPLPPILNVQMDNAARENKNCFVFYFLSLLVAKDIFGEVYMNFMLIGHIHDDIDALVGRWSMSLRKESFPIISLVMKSFMELESIPIIPHVIEVVLDFKGFFAGGIVEGNEAIEGHTKAEQFKFFVDSNGYLMMKYTILYCDNEWLPNEGGDSKLWREDNKEKAIWPCGKPSTLSTQSMRNMDKIVKGISGFIKY